MSGYKVAKRLIISLVIVILLTVLAGSGFVAIHYVVWTAGTNCKYRDKPINFTAVLGLRSILFFVMQDLSFGAECFYFFHDVTEYSV